MITPELRFQAAMVVGAELRAFQLYWALAFCLGCMPAEARAAAYRTAGVGS